MLFVATPAYAYKQYSSGGETSVANYSGVGVTYTNATDNVTGTSTKNFAGNVFYQATWAVLTTDYLQWVETGTVVACSGLRYYYYAEIVGGGSWVPTALGTIPSSDSGSHNVGLLQSGSSWVSRIDGVDRTIVGTPAPEAAIAVQAGLESHDPTDTLTSHIYSDIKYASNSGAWTY